MSVPWPRPCARPDRNRRPVPARTPATPPHAAVEPTLPFSSFRRLLLRSFCRCRYCFGHIRWVRFLLQSLRLLVLRHKTQDVSNFTLAYTLRARDDHRVNNALLALDVLSTVHRVDVQARDDVTISFQSSLRMAVPPVRDVFVSDKQRNIC